MTVQFVKLFKLDYYIVVILAFLWWAFSLHSIGFLPFWFTELHHLFQVKSAQSAEV